MPQKVKFPQNLCMPTRDAGGIIYPFGRWGRGYRLDNIDSFAGEVEQTICLPLRRWAWCLFGCLLTVTTIASLRHFGGPYISAELRPAASTTIVTLPTMLFFMGRRWLVYRRVRKAPKNSYLGRLYVWANIDNAFGAAAQHPNGAYVVAPWLDAGRKYRLDALDERTAQRIVWGSIALELTAVLTVSAALIGFWGQAPTCIYGVSLYYSISQPVLAGVELHLLLPILAERFHPRTFDIDAIVARRSRWLRIFVISSIYIAVLLHSRRADTLHLEHHRSMETYLYLSAYATAACYATLAFVCLTKTWAQPWSRHNRLTSVVARLIFLMAFSFLTASILEPIKLAYFPADLP